MYSSSIEQDSNWSPLKKLAFRFCFLLLTLFIIFNTKGAFPYFRILISYPLEIFEPLIPWFSKNIIHYNYTYDFNVNRNGSGDTSYHWILLLIISIVAFLSCIIWTFIDRKRANYNVAYYWLIVLLRFYLAFTLMLYGAIKVIKLQFPDPSLVRLLEPMGDASPMGLAWTFLGFSKGYNMFMGIVEIASIFLLFRKTIVFGALISLAATIHVLTMNYFFDVPVKILSTALVLMCLFILAPNFLNFYKLFFKNESCQLYQIYKPTYRKKWLRISVYPLKYLTIAFNILSLTASTLAQQKLYGSKAPKPFLYGIYDVTSYKIKGKEILLLTTDEKRWKQFVINWGDRSRVKMANDSLKKFWTDFDTKTKQVRLNGDGNQMTYKFKYHIDKNSLTLLDIESKDSVAITLKKKDIKKFTLINRGFHWINEYPYIR